MQKTGQPLNKKQRVYVQFPDMGLGNKMLLWARGFVFAHKFRLEFFCSSWWGIHPGSWIRNEKHKRLYWNYFINDSLLKKIRLCYYKLISKKIYEAETLLNISGNQLYCFSIAVATQDYFRDIKPYRAQVKDALYQLLQPSLLKELNSCEPPAIGIHIRRGDFKLGSTLTPVEYFRDCILSIRKIAGNELPAEIFTDADDEEIAAVLELPSVKVACKKADILDILLLSKSRICIMSIGSTFSFWGGFLSEGIVLSNPGEWHPPLRPAAINSSAYEGRFDPGAEPDPELVKQILQIKI